ncbi:MAG: hypothetical protein ACREPM_10305 [Gemmatimonadaceae bacterium]
MAIVAACCVATVPLAAQAVPAAARPFDHTIIIGGDWLQANALPLNRAAAQSVGGDVSLRSGNWAYSAGWLRIARDLSTVQGVTLSAGRVFPVGPVRFIPALSGLLGEEYVSQDTTGYNWVSGTTTGHEPRYSYSNGFAFGGGAGLTLEVPIYRIVGFRANVAEWLFGGSPLDGDRARTVVGAGLTIRVR